MKGKSERMNTKELQSRRQKEMREGGRKMGTEKVAQKKIPQENRRKKHTKNKQRKTRMRRRLRGGENGEKEVSQARLLQKDLQDNSIERSVGRLSERVTVHIRRTRQRRTE